MGLQWNSHINVTTGADGLPIETPMIKGYMTVIGENLENPLDGQKDSPKWTNENVLRICM